MSGPSQHELASRSRQQKKRSVMEKHGKTAILIAIITICIYANSCLCGFVFDDVSAVVDNKDLRPHTPLANLWVHDFWGTPMSREHSHKSYRPLCVLTFRLNYMLHGLAPLGYHLVNVILHSLVCVLYFKVCLSFVPSRVASICAILFSVHPIHTEAVTGVVGRAELLSSVFFLLTIITYKKASLVQSTKWPHFATSLTCVGLAMLCKEQGITVLGILGVYEVFIVQKMDLVHLLIHRSNPNNNECKGSRYWWPLLTRALFVISTGILLLLLRFLVMGHTLPVFTNFDNPASYEEAPVKQLTWAYLLAVNSWLLLSPSDLLCDWTMGTVSLVKSAADIRNLATLLFTVVLVHLGLVALLSKDSKTRGALAMGLAMVVLPFLPASNLFFPVGFVVAERVLYIPSMGFCLLVALGFHRLCKSVPYKGLLKAFLLLLVCCHSLKVIHRNGDWRDELTIFLSGLKVSKSNAKLWNNVGHALESQQKYLDALSYFQQAANVQPDDVGAHINVGRTLNHLERYMEAEDAYMKAKSLLPQPQPGRKYVTRIAPQHLSVFLNLGNLMAKDPARLQEADALYRQAISMRTDYVQAYINRGDVLIKLGKPEEALQVYEKALSFEPDNADLHYNLGVVYIELGHPQRALNRFSQALAADPDHIQSLMNSAILMQETGQADFRPEAYTRLFKVKQAQPDNERVYFNLGMLAMDDGDSGHAEEWFAKAIQLRPDFRSALFNLALLLNEQKKPLQALPHLKALLLYYPDHVKGLILMGDIYTNHVKDLAAAENAYKKILEVEPLHVQGRHNLCVVMVEQGNLQKAHDCLMTVHKMAPEEAYIKRHLQIVENRMAAAAKNNAQENEGA